MWLLYSRQRKHGLLYILLSMFYFDTILLDEGDILLIAIRCLALLLIPGKTKSPGGDIQNFIKFVSVSTVHDCIHV